MPIPLFCYNQAIHLTSTDYHGRKENTTMFQETLRIHQNMSNPVHITISDRDRVRLKITEDEELPFQLRIRIINRQRIVVYSEYLVPVIEGDFFKVILTKELVNSMESDETYHFTITQVDNSTQEETPLYIDHNFNIMGRIEVVSNFRDVYTEIVTQVDNYATRQNGKDVSLDNKFYFITPVLNNADLVSVEVLPQHLDKHCIITIERDNQSRYPMTERPSQWDEVISLRSPPEGTTLPINLIPERVYFRVVIHTDYPDAFVLRITKRS